MKSIFLALVMIMLVGIGWGQTTALSITSTSTVTNNVGSYAGTSGSLPTYWGQLGTGTNGTNQAGSNQAAGTSGGWYGSGVASNGGMSFLGSSTAISGNGTICYQNNTGSTITGFTLAYTAKMFKSGSASPTVSVSWSNSGTLAVQTQGALTNALSSLGFSDATTNISTGVSLTQTVSSISIANGQYIYVRFIHTGGSSSDNLGWNGIQFTASTGTPSIAISTAHPAASNIQQGSTSNILAAYQLDVTTANATLTGASVTTAGTYTSSDIATNGFKFWINSSVSTSGATQLGTSQAAVSSGGTVAVSGLTQSITSGTTRYVLVTADIANSAVVSNTISLTSTAFSSITFSSGTKTGTNPASASNAQTITACTGANVTSASASNGNTQSLVAWTNPSCFDEILVVAATTTNTGTPSGDGTAYTANIAYGSGTALGNGFVVYKNTGATTTTTGLTNGQQYFFKIFTRKGTTWTSGVEVTATPVSVTSATDYFRSNTASGDFATAGSWQSSVDNSNWITSTLVPNSSANTITIRNGHNIALTSSVTIDQLVILSGGQLSINSTSGTLNINDGTGNDVDIQSGGILQATGTLSYASAIIYSGSASINVAGKITIGDGTINSNGGGYGAFGFAAATQIIWNNAAIFEWNTSGATPAASGQTYFPNVGTTTIPIFRFAVTPSTSPGGGIATVINGQLQLAANLTWAGAGLKTFRNGITATGTFTLGVSAAGAWQIGDASAGNAEIGGSGGTLTLSNSNGINITSNCTATLSSNTTLSAGTLTNNGVLACGTNVLSGAGAYTNAATGSIATSNTGGVTSTIAVSGTKTYAAGSSFTFNANTSTPFPSTITSNQVGTLNVNANVTSNYASNLIITTACNVNSGTLLLNGTNHLVLNNSVPLTIASGATLNNGGESQILINSGTPTITINGTFITQDAQGFTGSNTAIPSITPTLGNTSTIEFGLNGNQIVTDFGYKNLTFSGSGTKTTSGAISSIIGTVIINSGVTLNAGNSTFGGSGTNLTMLGTSKFITGGSSTTPDATGTYSLVSTSTIEFSGSSATIIRSAPTYGNIDISGSNVGLSGTSTTLNLLSGSTFTVKNGGTFNVLNTNGFTGASNTAINNTNSPTISLASGSTINYAGSSSQVITNRNDYSNIKFSGGNTKTLTFSLSVPQTLTISTASDILAINGNTLTLAGTIAGSGYLKGSNTSSLNVTSATVVGTVNFDQTTSADVTVTNGTNALKDIITTGTGTLTLGNKVNLFERLSVGSGTTFNTGDSLVLRSIAGTSGNNTAYVDQVGGTITGQVRVERYVHAQSRGWRAITAPVTYNGLTAGTVANNWQNSWGLSANYGTRITGPSATNGLDDVSVSASLKTYSGSTGAWNNVTNTTTETMASTASSAANKSFFMYVRGDRTVTPNGYNPLAFQATTLPTRGKLQTGTQTFTLSGPANNYWLIGNPYACPVDMSTVSLSNIGTSIYVWDPNLTGSDIYSQGAYATFSTAAWVASGGSSTKYFQSGQAFFVQPTTSSASITFNESNKSTGNQNNQTAGTGNGLSDIFQIKLSFVDASNIVRETDGVMAMYGSGYSAGNDSYDAIKWTTAGRENLSLSRNNKSLVIEARPYITGLDTLFLSMTSMSVGANYQFKVNPINFDASVSSCKLVDNFLNTETPISLTNTTLVSFNVSSVAGSNAANRFYVVFNAAGSLPTSNSLTVKAYKQNNNSIKIDWEAIAENNVKTYTVEKSTDAASFSKLSEATAKNGNTTNAYSIVDNNPIIGVNYYRIQSVQTNNNKAYSTIVRVEMSDKGIKSITVYPNPVKSSTNTIGLQLNNLTSGSYTAVLYNTAGQQVWMNTMNHNGSNGSTSLQLNKTLASGTYQLQLTDSKGNSYKQTVLVVE